MFTTGFCDRMTTQLQEKIPQRSIGPKNRRLPEKTSIIGLGCSSFSAFFDNPDSSEAFDVDSMHRDDPVVQGWIQTIHYAVLEAGITLLDTAPWYGHGTSEVVVGWALEELWETHDMDRSTITVNTKLGRYEADPESMFDFSRTMCQISVRRSLARLRLDHVDVLQLHDPEFSPSLEILMTETIPAMLEFREQGFCRALGITGYPLAVQHQILEATLERFPDTPLVWDQALTYCHYNLHDASLFTGRVVMTDAHDDRKDESFADYCHRHEIALLAAAPLSMGLLAAPDTLPDWHPAPTVLKEACRHAQSICIGDDDSSAVSLPHLSILVALAHPKLPCTLLGMKSVEQVKTAHQLACRFSAVPSQCSDPDKVLEQVLNTTELSVYRKLRDTKNGPFAQVWRDGSFQWDGVEQAWDFLKRVPSSSNIKWQRHSGEYHIDV